MIYLDARQGGGFVGDFEILPRSLDISLFNHTMTIVNQSTNEEINGGSTGYTYDSNGILTTGLFMNGGESLVEGGFYTIEIRRITTNVLDWRGVLFTSSQVKADYSINNGEFKEKTSNNEYIILE